MKENIWNTKWKGAIIRHLEALKLLHGSSPSAISQVDVDKANSISMIFYDFVCLCLHLFLSVSPFPLILFLSFFSHIKVIPFYVSLQQLNHGRHCAKVNECITLFCPYKWVQLFRELFELKNKNTVSFYFNMYLMCVCGGFSYLQV